jgi:hypothetical protein
MVLVTAVGEEARRRDRPRRSDLGRPQVALERGDLGGELARGGTARVDDLAVDAGDIDAAPDEVVRDRAARRELAVARLDHAQLDLVLLGELREQPDHARIHLARADVLLRVGVEDEVLVLEQGLGRRLDRPARRGRWGVRKVGLRGRSGRRSRCRGRGRRRRGGRRHLRLAPDVDGRLRRGVRIGQVRRAGQVLGVLGDVRGRLLPGLGGLRLRRLLLGDLLRRHLCRRLRLRLGGGRLGCGRRLGGRCGGGGSSDRSGAVARGGRLDPGVGTGDTVRAGGAALGSGRGRRRRGRGRQGAADRREVDAAEHVSDRLGDVVEVGRHVLDELHHADALHRRGHHHSGEARLRLAHVEGHHRLARADRHLLRELVEPRVAAGLGGIAAEAHAERRIDEQALDQLGGDIGLRDRHREPQVAARGPRRRSKSGLPRTTNTGMKSASHIVPSTVQTT